MAEIWCVITIELSFLALRTGGLLIEISKAMFHMLKEVQR